VDDDVKHSGDSKTDGDETKKTEEDEFMKSLPEDRTQTTAKQQRILAKKVGILQQQQVGESWYPINKKWYDAWKKYIMWDKGDDDIDGGVDAVDESDIPRPDTIDNSDLADPDDEHAINPAATENLHFVWIHGDVWKLLTSFYEGGPAFERKVYERSGVSAWSKEKYICRNPQLVKLCYCDDKTGEIDLAKTVVKGFPKDYKINELLAELEDEMEWDEAGKKERPLLHAWLRLGQIKEIYTHQGSKKIKKISLDDFKDLDMNKWVEIPDDYLKTELYEMVSNKEDSTSTETATAGDENANGDNDDAGTPDDNNESKEGQKKKIPDLIMVLERKQKVESDEKDNGMEGVWPMAAGEDWREKLSTGDIVDVKDDQNKWYEGVVRRVYPEGHDDFGKFAVHYIGWNLKWDENLEITDEERVQKRHTHSTGPHRPKQKKRYGGYDSGTSYYSYNTHENGKPEQRGVVGLRNLGNTCFMNSTIQCLAQSPGLTKYFLDNEYMHHINKDNPLGWKGKVATAWAMLLHDMFSGKYRTVAPRSFKSAIGEVAPRFMGYAQQDSQELLSFLLDGLHEDLNQIKNKPATQPVESNNRADTIVAQESWKTYLSRNQSKIVDLMQAQYRSELVCPDCGRVSVTFDPYMFLSVPLPTEKHKVIEYTWVGADTSIAPKVYGQKVLKVADIEMLKQAIAKVHGVNYEELFVCDVWKSKIHRELRNKQDSVGDINRKSDDIFVYHSPRPDLAEWAAASGVDAAGDAAAGDEAGAAGARDEDERRKNDDWDDVGGYGGRYRGSNLKRAERDYQTFVINNQHQIRARHQYGAQERFEDETIGYPLLLTLPMKLPVTMKQVREEIWKLVKPLCVDDSVELADAPFGLWAGYGFKSFEELEDSDQVLNLTKRNLKFIVQWKSSKEYRLDLYDVNKRPRDDTAPPKLGTGLTSSYSNDARRGRGKPINLSECLHAFCEKETLSENDAWYCSVCKGFKCASKQIDLWDSPDLLIIHLKRFNYTRNWRDRINTLVNFPINGLDLAPFLLSEDHKTDAKYDLYAVSNHMGGMGGGHYTAYAKNLDNKQWYHLDDSRTSKVMNVDAVISSSAYVLYYYKVKPRELKHRASRVKIPLDDK